MAFKVYESLRKGFDHKNNCEDSLFHFENERWILAAVFDGCSSGKNSHVASGMLSKILQRDFKEVLENEKIESKNFIQHELFKRLVKRFFTSLVSFKEEYKFMVNELESTAIICLIDKEDKISMIIIIGDGVISINGVQTIIDQNNKPTYPIHFAKDMMDDNAFEKWFDTIACIFVDGDIRDISISTDGVQSFKFFKEDEFNLQEREIFDYMFTDQQLSNSKAMLMRKLNILRETNKMTHTDDIGIIRIIHTNEEKI